MSFLGNAFGLVLKERRKEKKLSQADIAKAMDVKEPTVSRWETGVSLPVDERIDQILKVLDINGDEYLSRMSRNKERSFLASELADRLDQEMAKTKRLETEIKELESNRFWQAFQALSYVKQLWLLYAATADEAVFHEIQVQDPDTTRQAALRSMVASLHMMR